MLSVDTANLNIIFVSNLLESFFQWSEVRQLNMDGRSQARSAISRARCNVPQMIVVRKLRLGLEESGAAAQPFEHRADIRPILHRNDPQLIFLIDPHQERLIIIVINPAARRPVPVEPARLQEPVALLEQKVVVHELLLVSGGHGLEGVEFASEVAREIFRDLVEAVDQHLPVLLRHAWAELHVGVVPGDSDSRGFDEGGFVGLEWGSVELGGVH